MKNPIKTFGPNLLGRDFCVGDLHGSFSVFENLCKNLNFNPEVDRMFSVGDLVDRGPQSLKCLGLIRNSWFQSVLANHEKMMLGKFDGKWDGDYWYQNGGVWGMEAHNDYGKPYPSEESFELHDLLRLVRELPFLITINTKSGKKFHILHAELPSGFINITDETLADPGKVINLATKERNDGEAFLWARHIFYPFYSMDLSNKKLNIEAAYDGGFCDVFNDKLSHIISGHTIVRKPLTIVGQTNIDTGAYNSYNYATLPYAANQIAPFDWAGLTCVELDSWSFYQATETTFKTIDPVVISREDLDDFVSKNG